MILAGFVAGSVWLAHRTPRWGRWPRRAYLLATGLLLVFGVASLAGIDANQRWGWPGPAYSTYDNPYADVADVYVVDENDQVLTDVRLLDQNGNPIDLGWTWCPSGPLDADLSDESRGSVYPEVPVYPRCQDSMPWWARAMVPSEPSPTPAPSPSATPTPTPPASPSP